MVFTNKELEKNFPLEERLKIEKSKSQNSPIFWINEYIQSHIPTADDVVSVVRYSKNITEQLESLYSDIEPFLSKVSNIQDLVSYIKSLEDQVEDLYKEKEEAVQSFQGITSISEIVSLAKGMEEQLKSFYNQIENG
jgi:DNA repair exonuclease SbcCD ATPase subunit